MNKKGYHVKTIEQLKILFSPKDVSSCLTKSHQVSSVSVDYSDLGVADEKPEGGGGFPPRKIGLNP